MKFNKKYLPLLSIPIILIPYIKYLIDNASCGWDCGFYIYMLERADYLTIHKSIESLYLWIFQPLVWTGINPVLVMKLSMVLMLVLLLVGIYLVCQRMKLGWIETTIAMFLIGFSPGIFRQWSDQLRNFLSTSLFPYFVYFYIGSKKIQKAVSYVIMVLMATAHRSVLMVFPVMWSYRLANRQYKKMIIETLLVMIPIVVAFIFIRNGTGIEGSILHVGIEFFQQEGAISNIATNWKLLNIFVGFPFLFSILGVFFLRGDDKKKFFLYMLLVFFVGSLLFSHLVAGRIVMMVIFPVSIIVALIWKWTSENDNEIFKRLLRISIIIVTLMSVVGTSIMIESSGSTITKEEMEFIDSIDIPNNSTLIAPSRLYWYTRYVWDDNHTIPDLTYWDWLDPETAIVTPETAWVYHGRNSIGDVYYIDGDHWFAGNGTLELKYSEKNI